MKQFIFKIKARLIDKYEATLKTVKETFLVTAESLEQALEETEERLKVYEEYYYLRCFKAEIKLEKVIIYPRR